MRNVALLAILMMPLPFPNARADDAAQIKAGRVKAQSCTRCHGRDGVLKLAQRSKWSGDVGSYTITTLTAFRDGTRSHAVMTSVASGLTDQDIADIGAWLRTLNK